MADTDKALRGGLRRAVFWPAMELLHRVRLAREGMSSKMSSETGCVVESFLLEQAELFAKLLVQYPCPSPDRVAAAGKLNSHLSGLARSPVKQQPAVNGGKE